MKKIKRCVAVLLAVIMLVCPLTVSADTINEENTQLQFKNGRFKILVLADIQDTNTPQKETVALINAAIKEANPDFIALTGDNIAGWWKGVDKEKTEAAVDIVAKTIDSYGIPFAFVFGNHDHEGLCDDKNKMEEEEAKKLILSYFQKYETCLAVEGEEMTGLCNYNLPIKDSEGKKDVFNLWFMDSNPYSTEEEGGGYGYVHEDQTEWYKKTSNALKAQNSGKPLPSILFQHIAVPEVYNLFTEAEKGAKGAVRGNSSFTDKYYTVNPEMVYQGTLSEGPCSPNTNHGQFDSWTEQGDIIGAVFGHDHINDFAGTYKGIKLIAAPGVTFYSYGDHRGVRTITLDESNLNDFETEILLFEDLVDEDVKNPFVKKHGYASYKSTIRPIIFGSAAGVAVLAAGVAAAVVLIKKRKKK